MRCITPPASRAGASAVQLVDSDAVLVTSVAFIYQPHVVVSSIEPVTGVLAGGTLLRVSGSGFIAAPGLLVRIGGLAPVRARVLSAGLLECSTPAQPTAGLVSVEVSLNERDYSADEVLFEYLSPMRADELSPARGPSSGGTLINVSGWGFSQRAALLSYVHARFNLTKVPVAWVSSREVHCVAPEHPAGLVSVELTQNDQQYTSGPLHFEYRDMVAHSIHPRSGPVRGGTEVVVRGASFDAPGALGLFCSFAGADVVSASFEGEVGVRCITPPASRAGASAVHLISNSAITDSFLFFVYATSPQVVGVSPAVGPVAGFTLVTITGASIPSSVPLVCVFRAVYPLPPPLAVPAVLAFPNVLQCTSPSFLIPGVYRLDVNFLDSSGAESDSGAGIFFEAQPELHLLAARPSRGLTAGGTLVKLDGTHFSRRSSSLLVLACRFNTSFVEAIYVSESEIHCVTPPSPAGMVTLSVTNDHHEYSSTHLAFEFFDMHLHAVRPAHGPTGGGTEVRILGERFDIPEEIGLWCVMNDFILLSAVQLSSSEVVCTVPASQFQSRHVVTLSLQLHGATSPHSLTYTYQPDPVIHEIHPVIGPVSGGTAVTIFMDPLIENSLMRCKFGSNMLVPMIVSSNEVQCISPPAPGAHTALLQLSINGQNFFGGFIQFEYHARVVIHSIWPTRGIVEGGTRVQVFGEGFSETAVRLGMIRCRFNTTEVIPIRAVNNNLICIAPAARQGTVSLEVSNNLQQFSDSGILFTYTSSRLLELRPGSGPVAGGTIIVVTMHELVLEPGLQCAFGTTSVEASFRASSQLVCISPPIAASSTVDVLISGTGMELKASLPFTYHDELAVSGLSPSWGPRLGGTRLSIYGGALPNTHAIACRFELAGYLSNLSFTPYVVSARWVSPALLECTSPPVLIVGEYQVSVSENGQDFSQAFLKFEYAPLVRLQAVTPSKGSTAGGTEVYIVGDGFSSRAAQMNYLKCKFRHTAVLANLYESDELMCISPAADAGLVALEVTCNNVDFTASGLLYEFVALRVLSVSPVQGPLDGGTVVTVRGLHFVPPFRSKIWCEWAGLPSMPLNATFASFQSSTAVECTTPLARHSQYATLRLRMGVLTQDSVGFYFYDAPSVMNVYPVIGPMSGGTVIHVEGTSFTTETSCMIGTRLVLTTILLSSTQLSCVSPAQNSPGVQMLELTSNVADFSFDRMTFQYIQPVQLRTISPRAGPVDGGTLVSVFGDHFDERGASLFYMYCRFDSTIVSAVFVSTSEIACHSPELPPGFVAIEVTNNNRDFSAGGLLFEYLQSRLLMITPSVGPVSGGGQVKHVVPPSHAP